MLTASERAAAAHFRSDQQAEVDTVFGPVTDAANDATTAQPVAIGSYVMLSFLLPDAATATYKYTVPDKVEIIDVLCIKDAAGAGNTVQLKDSAGTLDKATRVVAAGGEIRITNTRAAGSSACAVFVRCIRRA